MKTFVTLVVALVSLSACGDDAAIPTASDPAGSGAGAGVSPSPDAPAAPTGVPTAVLAAPGQVRSRYLPMVMDTGDGAQLCLGAIAESYPPQCGGPVITNWDWKAQAPNFEQQGDVRWGTFAVTGTWDGTAFTVSDAIPGALYDPAPTEPVVLPEPSRDYGPAELDDIAVELGSSLPGASGAYADQEGHVLVDVTYDDGTIQDYVDGEYGAGVVVVNSMLLDVP